MNNGMEEVIVCGYLKNINLKKEPSSEALASLKNDTFLTISNRNNYKNDSCENFYIEYKVIKTQDINQSDLYKNIYSVLIILYENNIIAENKFICDITRDESTAVHICELLAAGTVFPYNAEEVLYDFLGNI